MSDTHKQLSKKTIRSQILRNSFIVKHLLHNQGQAFLKMDRQNIYLVRNTNFPITMQHPELQQKLLREQRLHTNVDQPLSLLKISSLNDKKLSNITSSPSLNTQNKDNQSGTDCPKFSLPRINSLIVAKQIKKTNFNQQMEDEPPQEQMFYQLKGQKRVKRMTRNFTTQNSMSENNKSIYTSQTEKTLKKSSTKTSSNKYPLYNIGQYLKPVEKELLISHNKSTYEAKHGLFRKNDFYQNFEGDKGQFFKKSLKIRNNHDFNPNLLNECSQTKGVNRDSLLVLMPDSDRDLEEYLIKMKYYH